MTSPDSPAEPAAGRIAIVDDDPMWCFLTASALRERGWEVTEFDRGEALLAALPGLGVQALVIDALMPELDGFALCRRLREHPASAALPILMLTSLEDDESVARALDAGATDFFVKSTHWTLLAERLRALLRTAEMQRALIANRGWLAKAHSAGRVSSFDFDVTSLTLAGEAGSFAILGYAPGVTRVPVSDLLPRMESDRDALIAEVAAAAAAGRSLSLEFDLRMPDGSLRHLRAEGEPLVGDGGRQSGYRGAIRDVTDETAARNEIQRLASTDPLTGLQNRTLFLAGGVDAISDARQRGAGVAILVVDLLHFADVNQTLGHVVGDELLCAVADRMREFAGARSDGQPSERGIAVARLPGTSFALRAPTEHRPGCVQALAEDLQRALVQPYRLSAAECLLNVSVGIALYPNDGDSAGVLLSRADGAAAQAKASTDPKIGWFRPVTNALGRNRFELASSLHRALAGGELELHYQPVVDVAAGRIAGVEALMRWRSGGRLIAPNDFIPLAEETGLIFPMGEWALREACRQWAAWHAQGVSIPRVMVNLPSAHFERSSLLDLVRELQRQHRIPPRALELEITESRMLRDLETTLPKLDALEHAGVALAVDDFGTGYSSLSYLTRLPLHTLKIDRSFVAQLGQSRQSSAVARAIVALGQGLDLQVIAEGVETAEQLGYLHALGCTLMQGFHFARPGPAVELPGLCEAALARLGQWRADAAAAGGATDVRAPARVAG